MAHLWQHHFALSWLSLCVWLIFCCLGHPDWLCLVVAGPPLVWTKLQKPKIWWWWWQRQHTWKACSSSALCKTCHCPRPCKLECQGSDFPDSCSESIVFSTTIFLLKLLILFFQIKLSLTNYTSHTTKTLTQKITFKKYKTNCQNSLSKLIL